MTEWVPLPEQPPPAGVEACARCTLFRQRSRVLWAEGAPLAPVMVVLDNPGAREDKTGAPYVCGTRQTLQTRAQAAGLKLSDLYVTWVLKCRPLRAYDKEVARAACLPYLAQQVAQSGARVIVLLGNVALQAVLGDPALEVKALRGSVLTQVGHKLVCSYHPLAARRRPNLLPCLVEDLSLAARVAFPGSGP